HASRKRDGWEKRRRGQGLMGDGEKASGAGAGASHDVRSVLVVGAGVMGSGIAQVVAEAGIPVTLLDAAAPALDAGMARIKAAWSRSVEKGRRTSEEIAGFRQNLTAGTSLESVAAGVDLAIEAIIEDAGVKRSVFAALSEAAPA